MALMDAYGLSMMSVQAWGLLWGALSAVFIVGGLMVARTGLGSQPAAHCCCWSTWCSGRSPRCSRCRPRSSCWSIGMAVYMVLVPYAEAAEQTILQRVVPYERQGRVFGFAQSVEQAASPLTAFLIGPLTQLALHPVHDRRRGRRADRRLVRHRTGPRHRAGLRADRGARA